MIAEVPPLPSLSVRMALCKKGALYQTAQVLLVLLYVSNPNDVTVAILWCFAIFVPV